ncbi:FAD-binding oxidoreductase [Ktedonosporobacter rubrisoli]|uniref:FAD-binding oxidoreductase n=1 Tax=Ktedonosporobacter rubrisoli TaxID=2509675 RepID=A0A4P6JND8_KTERU|nr:FAD-binding oxidoreductase [Ktedonosporobacter rubrisoli]QBD76673.1 FAD-binding oxidoreductase [Ktedonosporobacter rubrisoli]
MKISEGIGRRKFLSLCAATVLAEPLAACMPGTSSALPATNSTNKTIPVPTNWSELAKSLQGELILPDNPRYTTAHQLFDPRFDNIKPAAIAYCASPEDVQTSLAFARHVKIPLVPRSGGHSYAGYSTSTGLVLDVKRMNEIKVDTAARTATIGAGARLIDVYATLARSGLALPSGSCPTVGIAGLAQGGGIGFLGRKFGLTCDNMLAAQIVLADGRLLTCDAKHYPDLFWALRGGGGGNFGVVTSFTFQVHQVPSTLSLFTLGWPWKLAPTVVDAWQSWAPQAPDELVSNCQLATTGESNEDPHVRLIGLYIGDKASLNTLLEQVTTRIGSAPTVNKVWSAGLLDAMLYEADCKSLDECYLPDQHPGGKVERLAYSAKSDFFNNRLSSAGIEAMLKTIEQSQQAPTIGGGIALDAYGGALNRVPADATAFVHRKALFCIQYTANWNTGDPASVVEANLSWLANSWQQMRPYASGEAYQNYIDPKLPDWQHAYYGSNLPRLQHIKALYDPTNFFHFAQSIPPAP